VNEQAMAVANNHNPTLDDTGKFSVLIADDHIMVLEGLAAIINRQSDMRVVAQAVNGEEACAAWESLRPSVTLMDLRMPVLDGVGAIERIHRQDHTARIIVLTTFDTDNEIYRAIKAGARGYLLKDVPRDELLDCMRRVHRGETCIPPLLAAKLASGMSNDSLTGRELDVLSLLAQGKSNKDIGRNLFIGETTVKSHLRSIFTKLNVLSRTEALTVASQRGLIRL
jgi:two-component system NarL family response regulator